MFFYTSMQVNSYTLHLDLFPEHRTLPVSNHHRIEAAAPTTHPNSDLTCIPFVEVSPRTSMKNEDSPSCNEKLKRKVSQSKPKPQSSVQPNFTFQSMQQPFVFLFSVGCGFLQPMGKFDMTSTARLGATFCFWGNVEYVIHFQKFWKLATGNIWQLEVSLAWKLSSGTMIAGVLPSASGFIWAAEKFNAQVSCKQKQYQKYCSSWSNSKQKQTRQVEVEGIVLFEHCLQQRSF